MGFTYDFNIHEHEIVNDPHVHKVKHIYRYEGNSDPGDSAVVYRVNLVKKEFLLLVFQLQIARQLVF
jgi:hypothetical protein